MELPNAMSVIRGFATPFSSRSCGRNVDEERYVQVGWNTVYSKDP